MIQAVTVRTAITQYMEGVMCGSITAPKYIRKLYKRHLEELERPISEEWPYLFNWKVAERNCMFFPVALKHSKGKKFAGKPFRLEPWQAAAVAILFGWQHISGTRRFRKVLLYEARKQGKSALAAGFSILLGSEDGEPGAEVYHTATKIKQARVVFDATDDMIQRSPALMRRCRRRKNDLEFPRNGGKIEPLGSDRPFSGLNPHAVVFDELHEWQEHHRKFYDTMTTGSDNRDQPLFITLTTAGDDKSLLLQEELKYARGVLDGTINDPTVLSFLYEIDPDDDPLDPECWIKANPNLGVTIPRAALEAHANAAKASPQEMNKFIRFHCNRFVSSVEDTLTADQWDAVAGELSDWTQADGVYAGVDLGGQNDLAAYGLVARFIISERDDGTPVYRYEATARAFISEDATRDLSQEPFATWCTNGQLRTCRYVLTDLMDSLLDDCDRLGIQYVAFDPHNARQMLELMEQNGLNGVKMYQSHAFFNDPTNEYLTAFAEDRFKPDVGAEVLRWCALNMCIVRDSKLLIKPDKKNSQEKIDAICAVLMALKAAMVAPSGYSGSAFLR